MCGIVFLFFGYSKLSAACVIWWTGSPTTLVNWEWCTCVTTDRSMARAQSLACPMFWGEDGIYRNPPVGMNSQTWNISDATHNFTAHSAVLPYQLWDKNKFSHLNRLLEKMINMKQFSCWAIHNLHKNSAQNKVINGWNKHSLVTCDSLKCLDVFLLFFKLQQGIAPFSVSNDHCISYFSYPIRVSSATVAFFVSQMVQRGPIYPEDSKTCVLSVQFLRFLKISKIFSLLFLLWFRLFLFTLETHVNGTDLMNLI